MVGSWPADASPRTVVIPDGGTGFLEWVVPDGVIVQLESVVADYQMGVVSSRPLLTVFDPAGEVIAQRRQAEALDANSGGSAVWALGLEDSAALASNPFLPVRSAFVQRQAPLTVLHNTFTNVPFTAVLYNNGGWVNLVADATKLTVPTTGYYVVSAVVRWAIGGVAGTARSATVTLNGGVVTPGTVPNVPGESVFVGGAFTRLLAAGDVLRLQVVQQNGGNYVLDTAELAASMVWKV